MRKAIIFKSASDCNANTSVATDNTRLSSRSAYRPSTFTSITSFSPYYHPMREVLQGSLILLCKRGKWSTERLKHWSKVTHLVNGSKSSVTLALCFREELKARTPQAEPKEIWCALYNLHYLQTFLPLSNQLFLFWHFFFDSFLGLAEDT